MGQPQSRESYRYVSLDQQNRHIRLLTLLPSPDFNSTIDCCVEPHSLNWNPIYDALSYTWGKPSDICQNPICFNGQERWVSANLETALRHLRYHHEPRVLWIDALCINQNDVAEKSTQIAMMGSIFEAAREVIIWLGPGSTESDIAMAVIHELQKGADTSSLTKGCREALENLFGRPWFSRTWVLPEFVRGRNLYFVCGDKSFSWDRAGIALGNLWTDYSDFNLEYKVKLLGGELSKIVSMASTRVELPRDAKISSPKAAEYFVKMLRIYKTYQATVPHDKIYGLLGLTDAFQFHGANPPAIDYERSASDVYTDWSRFLIQTGHSLDLLHLSQRNESDRSWLSWALELLPIDLDDIDDLPSWVPDWKESHLDNTTVIPLDVFKHCFKCTDLIATKNRLSSARSENFIPASDVNNIADPGIDGPTKPEDGPRLISFSEDSRLLTVRGYLITTFIEDFTFLDVDPDFINSQLNKMRQADLLYSILMMGHKIKDASVKDFARTAASQGRKQFHGLDGSVGLVPTATTYGDILCLLANTEIPFVLRPGLIHHRLIGDGYIEFPGKKIEALQLIQQTFTLS